MRADILPSLHNWRVPWEEGTPLFPWAMLVLMPLRLFSARLATAIINTLSVLLLALVVKRYEGDILVVLPILFSPIGYVLLSNGQTDVLVLSSVLLPAGWDLLLFWKPQVHLHAYWVRFLENPKTYIWVGIVLIGISFIVWGFWPAAIFLFGRDQLLSGWWNRSFWPYGIPLGLLFVYLSITKKDEGYGVMASPLLFPYVGASSYLGIVTVAACKWPKVFWVTYGIIMVLLLT